LVEGRRERDAEIAAEFVRLKVDVIVTYGHAVPVVRQVTATIPVVFAIAVDPLGTGIVSKRRKGAHSIENRKFPATSELGKEFSSEFSPLGAYNSAKSRHSWPLRLNLAAQ
jgi:hypothetical protein